MLEKIIPKYAWPPVLSVVLFNSAVYHITMFAVPDSRRQLIHMNIDKEIPFLPFFVIFYVLAFAQWALSWIMISRENKNLINKYSKADIIAKIICLICFILYPTCIERPSLVVNDFFSWLLKIVWTFDRPVNCFPSIHVLASYIAFKASFSVKKAGSWYVALNAFLFGLCMAAVVFTKQHYLIDIPAGIICGEIGILIAKKTDNERFLWFR